MKKIIALMLAIFMMAAIAVPAFAEEGEGESSVPTDPSYVLSGAQENVGGTKITYGTSQTYTVTIPAALTLKAGEASAPKAVTVSQYKLGVGKKVTITINSAMVANYTDSSDLSKWFLVEDIAYGTDGVAKTATDVPYSVYMGDTMETGVAQNRGAAILVANSTTDLVPTPVSCNLIFYTAGTSQATNFTDTVSFTATVS